MNFREKLIKREKVLGTWVTSPSVHSLDSICSTGIDFVILDHLLNLAVNPDAATSVQSITMLQVKTLSSSLLRSNPKDPRERGHKDMLSKRIESFFDNPYTFKKIIIPKAPPGSPIGSNIQCSQDDLN